MRHGSLRIIEADSLLILACLMHRVKSSCHLHKASGHANLIEEPSSQCEVVPPPPFAHEANNSSNKEPKWICAEGPLASSLQCVIPLRGVIHSSSAFVKLQQSPPPCWPWPTCRRPGRLGKQACQARISMSILMCPAPEAILSHFFFALIASRTCMPCRYSMLCYEHIDCTMGRHVSLLSTSHARPA